MRDHRPPVVTEYDWWNAMYDYMIEQLEGRFKLQFPEHIETLETIVHNMQDPMCRLSETIMRQQLKNIVSLYGATLTICKLGGCPQEDNHDFLQEFIELVWSVRDETTSWLTGQGIVIGQSFN